MFEKKFKSKLSSYFIIYILIFLNDIVKLNLFLILTTSVHYGVKSKKLNSSLVYIKPKAPQFDYGKCMIQYNIHFIFLQFHFPIFIIYNTLLDQYKCINTHFN